MAWSWHPTNIRLWDWESNQAPSIEASNRWLFGVTPNIRHATGKQYLLSAKMQIIHVTNSYTNERPPWPPASSTYDFFILKVLVHSPKNDNSVIIYTHTLISFQTCMHLFLLWNTEHILKNVGSKHFMFALNSIVFLSIKWKSLGTKTVLLPIFFKICFLWSLRLMKFHR